jgi:Phage integrase, N-terminal SAM-like domain
LPDSATLALIVAPRRRGKTLARRTYQKGYIYQEGRNRSDAWFPKEPAYVQFWRDVPGDANPRKQKVCLGICRTRTIAERAAAEKLEQLGINSTQTFIEATSTITFKDQGQIWLKSSANRKRNPLEQTTIDTRRYALDKWISPFFGDRLLADVNNLAMRDFVDHISHLAPSTIRDYSNIVKAVVASAINEKAEELFPRKWNEEFIDAPIIEKQNQPSTTSEGMAKILRHADGQFRVLYALLGGCGPLRAGEALGLEIGKHISEDCRTLYVRQKAKRGKIQPNLKTKHGERDIDLCTPLAAMLRDFIDGRTSGLLFCTSTGKQLLQSNTLQDSLHPILKKIEHEKGGFNIFRRFRITQLETAECPKALQHFWSGHAPTHVSERYKKLLKQRDWRLEWAERIGMGFELPARPVAPYAPVIVFPKAG